MVYLCDTTDNNGAIKILPKTFSHSIKKSGFWNRHKVSKEHLNIIDKNHITVEGKSFTTILFTPQFCVHKATLPKSSFRDVAVFLLYPGNNNLKQLNENELRRMGRRFGYMKNPFSKKPLRFGEE